MAEVSYKVNYEDQRFKDVEADETAAMDKIDQTYDGMIDSTDGFYQAQIDAAKEWEKKQTELQNQNTEFTIEKIEQDKAQAQKDYTKEQSGAFVDWQKQSNQYGVKAERQAASGLYGTGYSESSQVSMYNTYQNRVATARESYNQAVLNYNNSIKEARLQNSSVLAEIAYNSLQTQLQLSLEGFQYKNQLITDKLNQQIELDQTYWNRQQDILNQINTENALAENVRQYEKNYELQLKEFNEQKRQYEQSYTLQVKEYEEGIRQFNEEIKRLKAKDAAENAHKIKQLELEKAQLAEQKRQADLDYKAKQEALAEEKRQYDLSYALEKNKSGTVKGGSGGSGGGTVTGGGSGTVKGSNYIETPYYKGEINADAKTYGTFSNGYQPKGIKGYGAVKDSGDTIQLETVDLNGNKKTLTQALWKTPDGSLWYWEGRENKYKLVKENTAAKAAIGAAGGGNWWHRGVK